jgi:hypothetical protein
MDRVAHNHKTKTFEISCPKETSNDSVNTIGPQVRCHMAEEVVLSGFSYLPNKSYVKLKQTKFFSHVFLYILAKNSSKTKLFLNYSNIL